MSNELEIYNNKINGFFTSVANQEFKKRKPEVKMVHRDKTGVYQFTQTKYYEIPNAALPKIDFINIQDSNKAVVTLIFDKNPDLFYIKNILQLHSAKYTVKNYESQHPYTTLRIETQSLNVLAHLKNIYETVSVDATSLIWEALLYEVEYHMDRLSEENGESWRELISTQIDYWARSLYNDDQSINIKSTDLANFDKIIEQQTKIEYLKLSDNEKDNFAYAIMYEDVRYKAQNLVEMINQKKYDAINTAFNSSDKCISYIQNNLPYAENFIHQVQLMVKEGLKNLFAPGYFDFNSQKIAKDAKAVGSGVKSFISLGKEVFKSLPYIKEVLMVTDAITLVTSAMHFTEPTKQNKKTPSPQEVEEIASRFICMTFICNNEFLISLTKDSLNQLIKFYCSFLYLSISRNQEYEGEYSEYLLSKISDISYLESLGLKSSLDIKLNFDLGDGNSSIKSFILSNSKDLCYEQLLKNLSGEENIIHNNHVPEQKYSKLLGPSNKEIELKDEAYSELVEEVEAKNKEDMIPENEVFKENSDAILEAESSVQEQENDQDYNNSESCLVSYGYLGVAEEVEEFCYA